MSNYSQTTQFGPKDSLPLGNPSKLILGTDVDTELANIASAISSKYDASSIAAGPVGFSAGTVSLPSIYLGPDTTTGLYRVAANQVALAVSGANALTVSSTGLTVAGSVTANGAGTGLTVSNNATISGALTVSTGGSSIKGLLTIATPAAAGPSLSAGGVSLYDNSNLPAGVIAGTGLVANQSSPVRGALYIGDNSGWNFLIKARNTSGVDTTLAQIGDQVGKFQVTDDGGTLQTVGWRGTPLNTQSTNYTAVLSDRGKAIDVAANITVTIPASIFSAGDVLTVIANGSVAVTIAQGSGMSLFWANGTTTSGNRTLTGVGIATIVFITPTSAFIAGSALS